MAKIFFDTNKFIDLAENRPFALGDIRGHQLSLSPLSLHILCYAENYSIPSQKLNRLIKEFSIIPITPEIANNALKGPTADFEDNIQLHSAAWAESNIFLTRDKHLLNLKFFGQTVITDSIEKGKE